jgi:hypothetical protein
LIFFLNKEGEESLFVGEVFDIPAEGVTSFE